MEKMKETINPDILKKVEILLKEISAETNVAEIPDSKGMKLVRMNSEEFKKKEESLTIMFFEIPGNEDFCISTS